MRNDKSQTTPEFPEMPDVTRDMVDAVQIAASSSFINFPIPRSRKDIATLLQTAMYALKTPSSKYACRMPKHKETQPKKDLKFLFAIPDAGISGSHLNDLLCKIKAAVMCGHDVEIKHSGWQISGSSIDFIVFDEVQNDN